MEQPIRRGRPPSNALVVRSHEQETRISDLIFEGMQDIHRGYSKLQAAQDLVDLGRRHFVSAGSVSSDYQPAA